MKIYNYHPETKHFLYVEDAQQSPLEAPGIFLIPANATEIKPPSTKENELAIWQEHHWIIKKIPEPPKDVKFCPLLKQPCIKSLCAWYIKEECAVISILNSKSN
jgi:hypothetical protein